MSPPRIFCTTDQLDAAVGEHLGWSQWLAIDQRRIDAFADATGDRQWIHVDPARAAAGPYGGTVAHGYLTLSLLPVLLGDVVDYAGWQARVNYGTDKVRFPAPVPVGGRVRAGVELVAARRTGTGVQVTSRVTLEIEYEGLVLPRPGLVAETLTLLRP
ncbi:MAG: MaoC family dehydratase [Nocardioidaceae bacterium]